jgi:putative transposase
VRDEKKAEGIAVWRVQMLSPLLQEGLDPAKARQIRARICEETGLSDRSIRRYIARYREKGFEGLKPKGKEKTNREDPIPPHILEQAILLRREVPGRSVSQIIQILEWEGRVAQGQIKRSTLQEKLAQKGYSARHMKMYAQSGVAARRYQHRYRNKLWHSDIKYGPYLPIGKDGMKKQVYLVLFVDDCSRYVLHGEFYPVLDQVIVEDCFRKAIQKYGVPETVYFDNGKQYRTKWMTRACSKMGIRLLYAKPYSPESTGKPERLNRVVDSFLSEAALEKPQTLDKLNELFWVWLEECYQNKPHSALEGKASPEAAYRSDKKPLRFLEPEVIANAFLHCEELTSYKSEPPYLKDVWMDGIQVMAAREKEGSSAGLYLAAKGGHNDESHNHNDVGSCIVFVDGLPGIIDIGVETYTKKTFSSQRYDIWTMQSQYHNVPTINGIMQRPGREYGASNVLYSRTDEAVTFSLDIQNAYPKAAQVQYYNRTYRMNRGKNPDEKSSIEITDTFSFENENNVISLNFMMWKKPAVIDDGCDMTELVRVSIDANTWFFMEYDKKNTKTAIEHCDVSDERLKSVWGDEGLYRMVITRTVPKEGSFRVRIFKD